jgi:hypothetical protein
VKGRVLLAQPYDGNMFLPAIPMNDKKRGCQSRGRRVEMYLEKNQPELAAPWLCSRVDRIEYLSRILLFCQSLTADLTVPKNGIQ